MQRKVCLRPFEYCRIEPAGDVSFCNAAWIKNTIIGNIYADSFESIWNSPIARDIRRSVLHGSYTYCNRDKCGGGTDPLCSDYTETPSYPKYIDFSVDKECNLFCFTCRKVPIHHTDDEHEILLERIDKIVSSNLFKQAKTVKMSPRSDPFYSKYCRLLIQQIAQTYPHIRFELMTNGVCCSRKTLKTLGIIEKLDSIKISLHSATKETWMKFTNGNASQYEILIHNMDELSQMKKNNELKEFCLCFVVTAMNYSELVEFAILAKKLSATVHIWGYRNWGVQTIEEEKELTIYNPEHKDYHKLKEILKDQVFDSANVLIFPDIMKARMEALK